MILIVQCSCMYYKLFWNLQHSLGKNHYEATTNIPNFEMINVNLTFNRVTQGYFK